MWLGPGTVQAGRISWCHPPSPPALRGWGGGSRRTRFRGLPVCWRKVRKPYVVANRPSTGSHLGGSAGMTPFPRGARLCAVSCWVPPHLLTRIVGPRTTERGGAPPIHPLSGHCSPPRDRGGQLPKAQGGMREGNPLNPGQSDRDLAEYRLPRWRITRGGLKKKQEASWRTDGWFKSVLPLSSLCSLWGCGAGQGERVTERERERERDAS